MSDAPLSTERLWELLSDRLRGFLARRVADASLVDDLLQETFVRIHKGLDGLGDEQRIEPWVFQIARNVAIDHRRSYEAVVMEQDARASLDGPDLGEGGDLNDVVRDWLPGMIDRLPEPFRHAVRLYELERVPQQEIADRMGISLSGAKSRVQRGREKLKSLLFDCCSFEQDRLGNVIGISRNDGGACPPCEGD